MTQEAVAARIRHTGCHDGVVMVIWTSAQAEYKRYFQDLRAQKRRDTWAQMKEEHDMKPPKGPKKVKKMAKAAVERVKVPKSREPNCPRQEHRKKRGLREMAEAKAEVEDKIAKRTRGGKNKENQRDGGEDGCWVNIPSWSEDAMDFDWSHELQHGPLQRYPPDPNTGASSKMQTHCKDPGKRPGKEATTPKPNPNLTPNPSPAERGRAGQRTQQSPNRAGTGGKTQTEVLTETATKVKKRKATPTAADITGEKRKRGEQNQGHTAKQPRTTPQQRTTGSTHGRRTTGDREGKPRSGEG